MLRASFYTVVFSLLLITSGLAQPGEAQGQTLLAGTSFEVPDVRGTEYVDPGNPALDHDLANIEGQPLVDFAASGGELGFDARFVATRGATASGLTDGDRVGVTDRSTDVTAYPDGDAGYVVSDPDGAFVLTFDPVPLAGTTAPSVALKYYVTATGYESNDRFRVTLTTSGGSTVPLVDLDGEAIDADDDSGDANEGRWVFVGVDLSPYASETVTLRIEVDTNSSTEAIYVDDVRFEDGAELPVELASFTAQADGDGAALAWRTATETNNAGFRVQHRGPDVQTWATLGFVEGAGTTQVPTAYRFEADALQPGTHAFRLEQVDHDGTATVSAPQRVTIRPWARVLLRGPSPLVPGAEEALLIHVQAPQPVDAAMYDVLGRRVRTLYRGEATPGRPVRVTFGPETLPSGMYFVRVRGTHFQKTERISVVR